jgi:hypothetical protein
MMRNYVKSLALGITLLISTPSSMAASKALSKPPVLVQIDDITSANQVVEELVKALKRDQKARRFRLMWGSSGTLIWGGSTALYDRKAHTLRYYWNVSIQPAGEPEQMSSRGVDLYRGVTDQILSRLAAKNQRDSSSNQMNFPDELTRFGCRRKNIWTREHHRNLHKSKK